VDALPIIAPLAPVLMPGLQSIIDCLRHLIGKGLRFGYLMEQIAGSTLIDIQKPEKTTYPGTDDMRKKISPAVKRISKPI